MKNKRSLRLHLLAGLVLIVMTTSVLIQYLIANQTFRDNERQVMQVFLQREISIIKNWIDQHGETILFAEAMLKKSGNNEAEILQYLKLILEANPDYNTLYYGTTDNRMINASHWVMPEDFDLRTRPWYLAALRAGDLTSTPVFLNASQDHFVVTLCKPVYNDQGILSGVLAGDLPLDSLIKTLDDNIFYAQTKIFLTDREGNILTRTNLTTKHDCLSNQLSATAKLPNDFRQSPSGEFNCRVKGEPGIIIYEEIQQIDLVVSAFIPDSLVKANRQPLHWTFAAIILTTLVIWGVFVWYQRRHIDLPLGLLEKGISAIAPEIRPWFRIPKIPSPDFTAIVDRINGILEQIEHYYHEKNQAEASLKSTLTERESLVREVHHRVRHNLETVAKLLSSHNDPQLLEPLAKIARRVNNMLVVHEELSRSENLSKIAIKPVIEKIILNLRDSLPKRPEIKWEVELENLELDITLAVPFGQIISELVSNAIQHAFGPDEAGTIRIAFSQISSAPTGIKTNGKRFHLLIEDDGSGLPVEFDIALTHSFGLQLVGILCQELNADLTLDRVTGTRFSIIF